MTTLVILVAAAGSQTRTPRCEQRGHCVMPKHQRAKVEHLFAGLAVSERVQ